ncbi:MAG: ribonuclease H-like domain-containing protein [Planctomycetales bacterium]|nr:ribonuclease H-like domain-containing protein [Planctomycetales bacterium]
MMLSRQIQERLSELNRQRLPEVRGLRGSGGEPSSHDRASTADASKSSVVAASEFAAPDGAAPNVAVPGDRAALALPRSTSELPAGCETTNEFGSHWQICQPIDQVWPEFSRHLQTFRRRLRAAEAKADHLELAALARWLPESAALLDLETCGLGGAMIFLAGVVVERDGHSQLVQLLARNYAEERSLLAELWQLLLGRQVLVTFNGKSFDWPLVHDRSTLHHLGFDVRMEAAYSRRSSRGRAAAIETHEGGELERATPELPPRDRHDPRPNPLHCDLLHHARRRWRGRLPNCKLQTLEQYLCGRRRSGDIPGHAIPAAYHEYVRSGDAWQMRSILHHNALDLVTLLQLAMYCATGDGAEANKRA